MSDPKQPRQRGVTHMPHGRPGRVLGLDYGDVRIGLAVSDPDRKFAFPLDTYQRRSPEADAQYFQHLVREEGIREVVLGLPLHMDGREGIKAAQTRAFGEWLKRQIGLPVAYIDERFTSVEAERYLREAQLTRKRCKGKRDRVAAQIILQCYLDAPESAALTLGPLQSDSGA